MKLIIFFFIVLLLMLSLTGCKLGDRALETTLVRHSPSPTVIPATQTPTRLPTITRTNTVVAPTATLKPSSTLSVTPTSVNTLEPAEADMLILAMLQNPGDCIATCFWGIVPGKTTYDEANQIFYHHGMSPFNSTINGKDYASYDYHLNNELRISVFLGIKDAIVENIKFMMVSEAINGKAESDWMAYSPSAIIKQYGKPSAVRFSLNLESDNSTLLTTLYYDQYNLIFDYHNPKGPESSPLVECPLEVKYDYIGFWMGKNPYYPPARGDNLYEATSLTMDQFVNLMTGNTQNSCLTLDINAFLPHQ